MESPTQYIFGGQDFATISPPPPYSGRTENCFEGVKLSVLGTGIKQQTCYHCKRAAGGPVELLLLRSEGLKRNGVRADVILVVSVLDRFDAVNENLSRSQGLVFKENARNSPRAWKEGLHHRVFSFATDDRDGDSGSPGSKSEGGRTAGDTSCQNGALPDEGSWKAIKKPQGRPEQTPKKRKLESHSEGHHEKSPDGKSDGIRTFARDKVTGPARFGRAEIINGISKGFKSQCTKTAKRIKVNDKTLSSHVSTCSEDFFSAEESDGSTMTYTSQEMLDSSYLSQETASSGSPPVFDTSLEEDIENTSEVISDNKTFVRSPLESASVEAVVNRLSTPKKVQVKRTGNSSLNAETLNDIALSDASNKEEAQQQRQSFVSTISIRVQNCSNLTEISREKQSNSSSSFQEKMREHVSSMVTSQEEESADLTAEKTPQNKMIESSSLMATSEEGNSTSSFLMVTTQEKKQTNVTAEKPLQKKMVDSSPLIEKFLKKKSGCSSSMETSQKSFISTKTIMFQNKSNLELSKGKRSDLPSPNTSREKMHESVSLTVTSQEEKSANFPTRKTTQNKIAESSSLMATSEEERSTGLSSTVTCQEENPTNLTTRETLQKKITESSPLMARCPQESLSKSDSALENKCYSQNHQAVGAEEDVHRNQMPFHKEIIFWNKTDSQKDENQGKSSTDAISSVDSVRRPSGTHEKEKSSIGEPVSSIFETVTDVGKEDTHEADGTSETKAYDVITIEAIGREREKSLVENWMVDGKVFDRKESAENIEDAIERISKYNNWNNERLNRRSWLAGILVMDDGSIILADWANFRTVSFEPSGRHEGTINFSAGPWGLVALVDGTVACTIPNSKQIAFFSRENGFQLVDILMAEKNYWSIAETSDNQLICSYIPGLDVVSRAGQVLRKIEVDHIGWELIVFPQYIATTEDNCILVSDSSTRCLTRLSMAGEIRYQYKPRGQHRFINPRAVKVDGCNFVYVVDADTNMIYQLTEAGQLHQQLFSEEDGVQGPLAMDIVGRSIVITQKDSSLRLLHLGMCVEYSDV